MDLQSQLKLEIVDRIARHGFEPWSRDSESQMLGHYTTGLIYSEEVFSVIN